MKVKNGVILFIIFKTELVEDKCMRSINLIAIVIYEIVIDFIVLISLFPVMFKNFGQINRKLRLVNRENRIILQVIGKLAIFIRNGPTVFRDTKVGAVIEPGDIKRRVLR